MGALFTHQPPELLEDIVRGLGAGLLPTGLLAFVHLLVVSKAFAQHRLGQSAGQRCRDVGMDSRLGMGASSCGQEGFPGAGPEQGLTGSSPLLTASAVSLVSCPSRCARCFTSSVLGTESLGTVWEDQGSET